MCSRNKRGTAWSRNVSRSCFWDCNWGRTGHGQLLVNSFPCLYLVTVPEVFAKVTRPSFLPSKVLNDSSALQFFKFFDSYFGRSFLPAPPPPFRTFFYILPLLGVAFALPILQSPRLTGGPTQRKPMKWNYVYGAPHSPYTWASSNIFFALSCFLYQLCFKL